MRTIKNKPRPRTLCNGHQVNSVLSQSIKHINDHGLKWIPFSSFGTPDWINMDPVVKAISIAKKHHGTIQHTYSKRTFHIQLLRSDWDCAHPEIFNRTFPYALDVSPWTHFGCMLLHQLDEFLGNLLDITGVHWFSYLDFNHMTCNIRMTFSLNKKCSTPTFSWVSDFKKLLLAQVGKGCFCRLSNNDLGFSMIRSTYGFQDLNYIHKHIFADHSLQSIIMGFSQGEAIE